MSFLGGEALPICLFTSSIGIRCLCIGRVGAKCLHSYNGYHLMVYDHLLQDGCLRHPLLQKCPQWDLKLNCNG